MKKEEKKIIILSEPSALEQESIVFPYLDYLCVSESTVLHHLQLPPLKQVKAKPEKSHEFNGENRKS